MSETPSIRPDVIDEAPDPPQYKGPSLIEWIVVFSICAVLLVLLTPSPRSNPESARRTQCINRLRNLALALHNYHNSYGVFPPAYTVDSDGKPLHSWRTLILPYLDQRELYDKIDLTKAWDDPANEFAREKMLSVYLCPSADVEQTKTNYLAVVTPHSCLRPGQSVSLPDITDGLEKTLLLIEVANEQAVHWMSPWDADEQMILDIGDRYNSPHLDVFCGAFADGSVRPLPFNLPEDKRRGLISIDGNEEVAVE